jgi:hypothetical protein
MCGTNKRQKVGEDNCHVLVCLAYLFVFAFECTLVHECTIGVRLIQYVASTINCQFVVLDSKWVHFYMLWLLILYVFHVLIQSMHMVPWKHPRNIGCCVSKNNMIISQKKCKVQNSQKIIEVHNFYPWLLHIELLILCMFLKIQYEIIS